MRDNDRRSAQVNRIISACPIPCSLLEAVDGRAMSTEARNAVCARRLHSPGYPFALRPAEIGCFLSHRRAWQEILDRGLDGAAIFEDDVELERPRFDRALDLAFEALASADLVRLRLMHRTPRLARERPAPTIGWPTVTPLGTQAQVVGRRGAELLLAASERFDRPVDVFLQMRWLTGIAACEVAPSHVVDRTSEVGGTTIQIRRTAGAARIGRNLSRALYRARIRGLSILRPAAPASGKGTSPS